MGLYKAPYQKAASKIQRKAGNNLAKWFLESHISPSVKATSLYRITSPKKGTLSRYKKIAKNTNLTVDGR